MSVFDTRTLSRSDRRKLHTRDLLKAACGELLNERGYEALTIQAITDRADLGYGTFYLHFKDKDDIVWDVMHGYAQVFWNVAEAQVAAYPFPQREYLAWKLIFEYIGQVRDGFMQLFGTRGSAVLIQRYTDYLAELHLRNITDAKYNVIVDLPPEFLAQYMAGATLRLLVWWVETPNDYTPDDMASMLFEAVYHQPPPRV